jgi:hypothetical protein
MNWYDFLWMSVPAFLCMIRLYFLIVKKIPIEFGDRGQSENKRAK